MATKGMIISLFVILIIWIFYKFNIPVPIPRVNIRLPEQKNLEVRERISIDRSKKLQTKVSDKELYRDTDDETD